MKFLSKYILFAITAMLFWHANQLVAGDMQELIAAGVDVQVKGPLAKDLPVASYLITINNKSATPIVYDPAGVADKAIYGSGLLDRFKVAWKKEALNIILFKSGWTLAQLAILFYLNQPLLIYQRAHAQAAQATNQENQGDDPEASYLKNISLSDVFWLWIDYHLVRSIGSNLDDIFKTYKALRTVAFLEKITTIAPSESIQFLLLLKNKNDKPLDLIYSTIQIKDGEQ